MGTIVLNITTNNVTSDFYSGSGVFYNGSINIVATGGTSPYSYTLVNAYQQNNGYFPLLPPGTYAVIVTDAIGETADTAITITSLYPSPSVSFSNVVVPTSCSSSDGSFTLVGSGGPPPYTYSIDGGITFNTSGTFSNLTWGVYNCILKDANGMVAVIGTTPILLINYPSNLYFNCNCCSLIANVEAGVVSSCTNNIGQIDVTASGGIPPYLFSIDGINYYPGYAGYGGGWRFLNLPPGIYTGYAKDSTGAISKGTTEIINYCNIAISWVEVDASCKQNNGSLTVHATNGAPPYLFTMDGINYQTDSTFTGLSVGTYGITVKDANGNTNSARGTVFDKCPIVTATETDETCGQNNGTITATGIKGTLPYLFSDNDISFQSSNIFSNLDSGNYTITIKDANGFLDSTQITINNNCLKLILSPVNTTCSVNNGSITASGSNGTTPYAYSLDGINFQAANVFYNLAAGAYTITMEDATGLMTLATTTLNNAPGPQISVMGTQASCANTNGTITITAIGGTPPFQYSIDNGNTYQTSQVFTGLDSGEYFPMIQDANLCIISDTVILIAAPTPKFFIGNDSTLCVGQTLLLSGPQSAGYQYLWQDSSTASNYTVTSSGTYWLTVTNQYGCAASDTISVYYQSVPTFSIGNDTSVCTGQSLILHPSVVLLQASYLWSTGATSESVNINSTGLYWLQVSDNGCMKSDSITVTYSPSPILNLGNDTTLCVGQTLLLNAANNNAIYLWQDGSANPTLTVDSPGIYSVAVSENGCDTSAKINISYTTKPLVYLGADTTVCVTEQLLLNASYPQSTYEWQDGTTQPTYTVSQAGTYYVEVTNNCGDSKDSITVSYENCACKFYVPSAFTPNHDGINDVFLPKYQCLYSNYELRIFNRWGQLIFISANPSNGWDGNLGGQPQPTGTYVWEMEYKDNLTGRMMHKNGTVVLIR